MFNDHISLIVLLLGGNVVVRANLMLVDFITVSKSSVEDNVLFRPLCYSLSNIVINFVNIWPLIIYVIQISIQD